MSFIETFCIPYEDTDQNSQLKPVALLQYFQKMAMRHSRSLGYTKEVLQEHQIGWMLHLLQYDAVQMPTYEDEITIKTWSQSINGFKGLRRFEISLGGAHIITADTLWLFLDMKRRRVRRVPQSIIDDYKEPVPMEMETDIDKWRIAVADSYDTVSDVFLRRSDIDTNLHVNNAIYGDMVETAVAQSVDDFNGFNRFVVQFQKEIKLDVKRVNVGLFKDAGRTYFNVFQADTIFASGEYGLF